MENEEGPTGGPDELMDVKRACVLHRKAMFEACNRILNNWHDAEDATHEAVLDSIMADPPGMLIEDWQAWLCKVAVNAAKQFVRAQDRARQRDALMTGLPSDESDEDGRRLETRRLETRRLSDRVDRLMSSTERDDLELYRVVALKRCTEAELATQRGVPLQEIRRRRRRALAAVRAATVAVLLMENPGIGKGKHSGPSAGRG